MPIPQTLHILCLRYLTYCCLSSEFVRYLHCCVAHQQRCSVVLSVWSGQLPCGNSIWLLTTFLILNGYVLWCQGGGSRDFLWGHFLFLFFSFCDFTKLHVGTFRFQKIKGSFPFQWFREIVMFVYVFLYFWLYEMILTFCVAICISYFHGFLLLLDIFLPEWKCTSFSGPVLIT